MGHGNTILRQLLAHILRHQFQTIVDPHQADRYAETFTAWNQLTVLLYAQAGGQDGLRDIEQSLDVQGSKTYHRGLPNHVRRSTLSDANGRRDWGIFKGLFGERVDRCRSVTPKHKVRFKNPFCSLDSTTIALSPSMFPWARYRTTKRALKRHTQFDYSGHIPSLVVVTEGRENDLSVAKKDFPLEPDSIDCFDRAYADFGWVRRLEEIGCGFVTRMKANVGYRITGQQESLKTAVF